MPVPLSLDVRTVVVLFHGDRLLLLQRAAWKKFAPLRWTGLGGKVESDELGDLVKAAQRELFEETDLSPSEVSPLCLRRLLLFHHPVEQVVCLAYLTGTTASDRLPTCKEGRLHWIHPNDLAKLDLIENTARVLPFLIQDVKLDDHYVRCGVAEYDGNGRLLELTFPTSSGKRGNLDTSNSGGI